MLGRNALLLVPVDAHEAMPPGRLCVPIKAAIEALADVQHPLARDGDNADMRDDALVFQEQHIKFTLFPERDGLPWRRSGVPPQEYRQFIGLASAHVALGIA